MDSAQANERYEVTHLESFCRQIGRAYDVQLQQRRIVITLDIDPSLCVAVPRHRLREALTWCLDDAIQALPTGGEIELMVVDTARGIEIEVADSSELPLRREWQNDRPLAIHGLALRGDLNSRISDVRVEMHRCPQGGWARTLTVAASPGDGRMVRRAA